MKRFLAFALLALSCGSDNIPNIGPFCYGAVSPTSMTQSEANVNSFTYTVGFEFEKYKVPPAVYAINPETKESKVLKMSVKDNGLEVYFRMNDFPKGEWEIIIVGENTCNVTVTIK